MSKINLIVEYEAHPDKAEQFDSVLRAHAARCLAEEPGTLRFEVLRPLGEDGQRVPNRFMANELFTNAQALNDHRATDRFATISEQFKRLLVSRRPVVCEVLF